VALGQSNMSQDSGSYFCSNVLSQRRTQSSELEKTR
jgi:hypothetical protein